MTTNISISRKRLLLFLFAPILCCLILVYHKPWILRNIFSNKESVRNLKLVNPNDVIESLKSTDVGEPVVQTRKISDIFVPLGQNYNAQNGIVYDCLSRSPYTTVTSPSKRHRFVVDQSKASQLEDSGARQKSFQNVFENQIWIAEKSRTPQGNKMSSDYLASGHGSTLEGAQPSLALLNSLIDRLKIYLKQSVISIVDIPCGDFYWMRQLVGRRSDIQYTGIDIVPSIIERNNMLFKDMKNAQFVHKDIVKSGLNKSYDIIFSRDMLQHLTNIDAQIVLGHFSDSGSKILVITNLIGAPTNVELDLGHPARYRHLNLMLPPMSLVSPVCSIQDDFHKDGIKYLSVWTLPLHQQN